MLKVQKESLLKVPLKQFLVVVLQKGSEEECLLI